MTGPAAQVLAGVSFAITDYLSIFTDYKAAYSWNDADLNGGGSLETNILTHNFSAGISISLGRRAK